MPEPSQDNRTAPKPVTEPAADAARGTAVILGAAAAAGAGTVSITAAAVAAAASPDPAFGR